MRDKLKSELQDIASTLDRAAHDAGVDSDVKRLVSDISPDEPIQFSSEDRLNRTGFATELARAIVKFNQTESVVVGIHGNWGTGKTSLLNLVAEQLQVVAAAPPVIFRFNPWGFSDQEQLTTRFFGEMAAFLRLHMSIPPLTAISDTVEEYGELLSPMARILFPRASEAVKFGWNWFRKIKPARSKTATELKANINNALHNSGAQLIIMIDDIDRLNATEIRQVFQLIKLNANFSNTVYVVAFDRRPVERALKQIAPGPAREYLEKIVQISFVLPPISEQTLTEIILSNFNDALAILTTQKLNEQRFGNMFQSGFRSSFRTIRDVNRYFNLFRFALNLLRNDTDVVDLAAVQAISLFYPSVYRAIEANPKLFCGGWGALDQQQNDKEDLRKTYDKLFSHVSERRRPFVYALCEFLFPKMELLGARNAAYPSEWDTTWQKTKRIASSKYFSYYFQLAVPDTDVSQSEFDNVFSKLTSVEEFVHALRHFKASHRFATFIDLLRDNLRSLEREKQLIVLESIFVFGDELETEGALLFGVISEHLRFALWLLFDILDLLPPGRFETLCQIMRGKQATFTISDTTAMLEKILQGGPEVSRQKHKYPDLTEPIISDMKRITVEAIEQAARENRLLTVPKLAPVLYRWKLWGDAQHAIDWVASTFLTSPKQAVSLVVAFSQRISSMGSGDKVPRVRLTVPVKILSEFADLNLVADLVRRASDDELNQGERESKTRFLEAKARLDAGEDPDARFSPEDEEL